MSGKATPKKGNTTQGKHSILPGPTGVRRPALKSLTQTPEERRLIEALMRQQPDPTEILNGFIQRFHDIDAAYQRANSQSGFGSVSSSSLESSIPVTQLPQPPFGREQSLSGFTPPPTPLREGEGVEGLPDMPRQPRLDRTNSAASSVSAFAASERDISVEEMRAARISEENIVAILALPNLADSAPGILQAAEAIAPAYAEESASIARAASVAASANQDAIAPYVEAAAKGLSSVSDLQAAAATGLQSEAELHAALQQQQQRQQAALLRNSENQRLLDNIDAEFDELITAIFNSRTIGACLSIISKLNNLFALIIRAIGAGLGFAIKYPKLALLLIVLAYLQSSTCAFIINKTIKFVWWITTYLFGMTTAGQKIAGFVRQIIGVYQWCVANGRDSFVKFQQLVEAVAELQKNMGSITDGIAELRRLAASLGISVEELMQIILSMQSTFGQPATGSGVGQTMWNMLGHFASGAGSGAAQALLGNGAGPGGFPQLRPGGGKRKPKSKTNKKRKSKSNKKGKTKTRRR